MKDLFQGRSPEITLGKRYRDSVTGYEGIAVAVTRYLHMCDRVSLSTLVEGKPEEFYFDSPGLELIEDDQIVNESPEPKTGGFHPAPRRTY